ncbi:MAG: sensor histidine kinase [Ardenticatenia bacterium]|nr:MAG: sensor histidine kinase [Ardenticatenia bacterium]
MAAIAMQADFIMALLRNQPDRAPEELQQLRENALQTAQELRTLMFTLRPVVLETEGLVPALEQYVKRLREQDNLNITLYADPLPKMDDTLEQTVFAIVQEAVGNAKKHAQGAPITVRLERTARGLLVQVQDEGPGFDVEEVLGQYGRRTSLGMVNMRERAEIINGVLDIESAPGQGTTVSLFVPL